MGEGTREAVNAKLASLKKLFKSHKEAFGALKAVAPKSFNLPADLAKARSPSTIKVSVVEGQAKIKLFSAAFEDQVFDRPEPWVIVVSFVVTAEELPHLAIGEHSLAVPPPVVVDLSESGVTITERKPKSGKSVVSSELPVGAVCESLRGEVRYTRADEPLRLQASFVPVARTEGGK